MVGEFLLYIYIFMLFGSDNHVESKQTNKLQNEKWKDDRFCNYTFSLGW